MALLNGPKIVTSGLVLNLDAADRNSYPGSGTTWTDLSGNGNNGTLTNGPTFNSANGGSIVFDGVDDFITGSNLGNLTNFTANCWFYPTSNPNNNASVITDVYLTGKLNFVISWGNIEVAPNTFFGGFFNGDWVKTPGIPAILNQWWNLTLTFTSGELKFYSSGILISTTATARTPINSGGGFRIGRRWDLSEYFIGRIPSVQIYNRALSAQEVLQNYNATKTRYGL